LTFDRPIACWVTAQVSVPGAPLVSNPPRRPGILSLMLQQSEATLTADSSADNARKSTLPTPVELDCLGRPGLNKENR
jgi:hypothetical protein